MKLNRITILKAVAASSLVVLPAAQAQNQDSSRQNNPPANVDTPKDDRVQAAEPQRGSDLIGMEVMDSQAHKTGTVRDLLIDLKDGNIIEVVVGPGGLVRSEDKLQALPPSCFTYAASGKDLRLNSLTADELKNAPTFNMSRWKEEAATSAKVTENYQYFHATARTFGDRDLERASLIMGATVRNDQDQKLGRVENLVVVLPQGRIEKVILSSGGFLGIESELTAFAPQSFAYNPESDRLTLSMTPESIKSAPHFKASEWRSCVTAGAASPSASITPASPNAGLTGTYYSGQSAPVAAVATSAQTDSSITTEIQQKLHADNTLSANARNVSVETHAGKVTLRGTVDTRYDHLRISEIAASVASINDVDNQTLVAADTVAGNVRR